MSTLMRFLEMTFYHGTARKNLAFAEGAVAYFTPDRALAEDMALRDAEVDGGVPYVIEARLNVDNPLLMDNIEMQDLHLHPDWRDDIVSRGFDCAIGRNNLTEIAVFDRDRIVAKTPEPVTAPETVPSPR